MVKGAIFDLDGTLLSSMHVWLDAGERYLVSKGVTPDDDLYDNIRTMSIQQAACHIMERYNIKDSEENIIADINRLVEDSYKYDVILKDGVKEFLQKLNKNGVKMCIATATDRYLVEAALKRLDLSKYFKEIFTCTSVGSGKDTPVIYNEALKSLGTKKEETVVFEDSLYAIRTAKKDGFTVVAVYDDHETNQEEVKTLADYYTVDFSNINIF